MSLNTLRLVPHGNAYGKTHRINAIAKKLPSTRNIHRIVSVHTRQLRLAPTTGKSCSTYAEPVRGAVTSSRKSSEEAWLPWLHFCLFTVVGAEGTGQSFSPVNVCKSLNLPDKIIKVPVFVIY